MNPTRVHETTAVTVATRRGGEGSRAADRSRSRFPAMAARRRPRGSVVDAVALFAEVDPQAKANAQTIAETLGVTTAEFVEALLLHAADDLDAQGVPTWWTKPLEQTGELDLEAS